MKGNRSNSVTIVLEIPAYQDNVKYQNVQQQCNDCVRNASISGWCNSAYATTV